MTSLLRVLHMTNQKQFRTALAQCMQQLFNIPQKWFDVSWVKNNDPGKLDDGTGNLAVGTNRPYWQPLADDLFPEWQKRRDPAWLYTHPSYMWDSIGCSVYESCPAVGHGIQMLWQEGFKPKRIIDLGAGPGFTTMMLAHAFPDAEVHYHEYNPPEKPGALEKVFKWFDERRLATGFNKTSIQHVNAPQGVYDLVVAMEYVEHIVHPTKPGVGDPMAAIDPVLLLHTDAKDARFLMHSNWAAEANGWTTLGHFLTNRFDGVDVPNKKSSAAFKKALATRGWHVKEQGFNACPLMFSRDAQVGLTKEEMQDALAKGHDAVAGPLVATGKGRYL